MNHKELALCVLALPNCVRALRVPCGAWHKLAASLLAFFLLFTYAYAATCGNSSCESGENACNCPADCGKCEGAVPERVCKQYACVTGFCKVTSIPNCCGNGLCESGESYGNCPADCMPKSVKIEVLEPVPGVKYLRGDQIPFKLRVTADDRPIASADVNAESILGFVQMYNDGRHNDDLLSDNIYGNFGSVLPDAPEGVHRVELDANFIGIKDQKLIDIEVYPRLDYTMDVSDTYVLGNIIELKGSINRRGKAVPTALDINMAVEGVKVFEAKANSDRNGNFSVAYHTTLLDPLGVWQITVFGIDEYNNYVLVEKDTRFEIPHSVFPLTIEQVGAFEDGYERGSEVTFVAKIKDEFGTLVEGASAEILTPVGERIKLSELQPGQYTASYSIDYSTPLGVQRYGLVASYEREGSAYRGTKNFDVKIEQTSLTITILSPTKRYFQVGETMNVEIEVTYPDGRFVKDASVQGLFGGKQIKFAPVAGGVFRGSYTFSEEDAGSNKMFLKVDDTYGNTGLIDRPLDVAGKTLLYYVQQNIVAIVLVVVIVSIPLFFFGRIYYRHMRFARLTKRSKELVELEKDLQVNYFENATITKNEYKELMDKYEAELKKIENSLERMKQGK